LAFAKRYLFDLNLNNMDCSPLLRCWSLFTPSADTGSYPSPPPISSNSLSTTLATFFFSTPIGLELKSGASTQDYKYGHSCNNAFALRHPALIEIAINHRPILWKSLLSQDTSVDLTITKPVRELSLSDSSLVRSDVTRSRFPLSPLEAEASTLLIEQWMASTQLEYRQELSIIAAVTVSIFSLQNDSASVIVERSLFAFSRLVESLILPSISRLHQHTFPRSISQETKRVSFAVEILSFFDSVLHLHLFNMGLEGELWVPQIASTLGAYAAPSLFDATRSLDLFVSTNLDRRMPLFLAVASIIASRQRLLSCSTPEKTLLELQRIRGESRGDLSSSQWSYVLLLSLHMWSWSPSLLGRSPSDFLASIAKNTISDLHPFSFFSNSRCVIDNALVKSQSGSYRLVRKKRIQRQREEERIALLKRDGMPLDSNRPLLFENDDDDEEDFDENFPSSSTSTSTSLAFDPDTEIDGSTPWRCRSLPVATLADIALLLLNTDVLSENSSTNTRWSGCGCIVLDFSLDDKVVSDFAKDFSSALQDVLVDIVSSGLQNSSKIVDASDRSQLELKLKTEAKSLVQEHVAVNRVSSSSFLGADIIDEMKLFSDSSASIGIQHTRKGGGAGSYLPPNLVINGDNKSSSSSPDDETAACELRYPRRHSVDKERTFAVLKKSSPSLLAPPSGGGPLVVVTMWKGGDAVLRGIRDSLWTSGISRICALL
jgi:hypothetical protein